MAWYGGGGSGTPARFGQTWWSQRWLAVLGVRADDSRLSRGRSYARSGRVLQVLLGEGGRLAARVRGSHWQPYDVTIRIAPLPDAAWGRVIEALRGEAIYAAKLLGGELPRQVDEVLTDAGESLFPIGARDLQAQCTCYDWVSQCKHVVAVWHVIAQELDADPLLYFELRGRHRDEVLAALAAGPTGTPADTTDETGEDNEDPAASLLPVGVPPTAFWQPAASLDDLDLAFAPPAMTAAPVKQLGVPPFWYDRKDFVATMEAVYRAVSEEARRVADGEG